MLTALAAGILLGLGAGLSPGPLLALVLAQTLQRGAREGCKVALSPLVTDAPIILAAWMLSARLAELQIWLGVVSLAGAAFVLFLAWETLRSGRRDVALEADPPRSLLKGILTNVLSPHPWLFWLTVGTATLANARSQGWLVAAAFLAAFYLLLVGSKIVIALLVGRSRGLLAGQPFRLAMRALSGLLAVFAILLFREGLRQLGVI